MIILSARGISKQGKDRSILSSIDLDLEKGGRLAIAGETGSGKTSLLEILGGRGQAQSGTVYFNGQKVPGTAEKLVPGHPGIAYLSQHFELPPHYWIHEILAYASDMSEEARHELYRICRIGHLLDRRTNQLSGGERQRVALARELSSRPQLLLLDEPLSNLDAHNKRIMRELINDISRQLNITQVLVSHDATDQLAWADHMIVLKKGKIVQAGKPADLYRNPSLVYVAGLLGAYSLVDPMMPAFEALPFPVEKNGKWMIRPEDIQPAPASERQLTALVQRVEFHGHYYACQLKADDQLLVMHLLRDVPAPGERVGVKILKAISMFVDR